MVGKVDIRDLTWEQKEKVLRLLFARMNRVRTAKVATPQVLPKAPKLGPNRYVCLCENIEVFHSLEFSVVVVITSLITLLYTML